MGISKTNLSTDEICRILETSSKSGVIELKFGDLHVTFGTPAGHVPSVENVVEQPPVASPVLTDDQHKRQSEESLEMEQVRLREEQLARALVEDPVEYERLLSQGELSDELDTADSEESDNE